MTQPSQKLWTGASSRFRGLWVRNERYYAQITVEDIQSGAKKVRLVPSD